MGGVGVRVRVSCCVCEGFVSNNAPPNLPSPHPTCQADMASDQLSTACLSPSGDLVALGGSGGYVHVWGDMGAGGGGGGAGGGGAGGRNGGAHLRVNKAAGAGGSSSGPPPVPAMRPRAAVELQVRAGGRGVGGVWAEGGGEGGDVPEPTIRFHHHHDGVAGRAPGTWVHRARREWCSCVYAITV